MGSWIRGKWVLRDFQSADMQCASIMVRIEGGNLSNKPSLLEEDRVKLVAFQETYDTETLIRALMYKEANDCMCDECCAKYLRAMADRIDPCGLPQLAIIYGGVCRPIALRQEDLRL